MTFKAMLLAVILSVSLTNVHQVHAAPVCNTFGSAEANSLGVFCSGVEISGYHVGAFTLRSMLVIKDSASLPNVCSFFGRHLLSGRVEPNVWFDLATNRKTVNVWYSVSNAMMQDPALAGTDQTTGCNINTMSTMIAIGEDFPA